LGESGAGQRGVEAVALHPPRGVENGFAVTRDEDATLKCHCVGFSHNYSAWQVLAHLRGTPILFISSQPL
jgi:hypothetical protein